MPKKIFHDFLGGLALRDRNIPDNQFNVGDGLDIHSMPGYILPSLAISTLQTSGGSIIRGTPLNLVVDSKNGKAYIIADNGDLYQVTSLTGDTFNSNFDGSAHYYKAIGSYGSTPGQDDLIIFNSKLCYAYNTSNHAYVGTYDLSSSFNDTALDLGNAATSYGAPHRMLEWNGILWIANGRYLAKSPDASSVTNNFFDLGEGWEITDLFPTQNYIGICAWKSNTAGSVLATSECRVFFYDGVSNNYAYFIQVKDNKVFSASNYNGNIVLSTGGRINNMGTIAQLSKTGMNVLHKLKLSVGGTVTQIMSSCFSQMTVVNGKILLCTTFENGTAAGARILSFGHEEEKDPNAFTFPINVSNASTARIFFIKPLTGTRAYIGWRNTSNVGTLSLYDLTASTYGTALWKPGYVDLGQRVRINYIKFYFKPLVSGDSITPTIDTDYGTSNTLKDPRGNTTISFTNDGGTVTSKRFNCEGLEAHAFRPALSWTAGGTPFSKIEIDYSPTPDDY